MQQWLVKIAGESGIEILASSVATLTKTSDTQYEECYSSKSLIHHILAFTIHEAAFGLWVHFVSSQGHVQ